MFSLRRVSSLGDVFSSEKCLYTRAPVRPSRMKKEKRRAFLAKEELVFKGGEQLSRGGELRFFEPSSFKSQQSSLSRNGAGSTLSSLQITEINPLA